MKKVIQDLIIRVVMIIITSAAISIVRIKKILSIKIERHNSYKHWVYSSV